MKSSKGILSSKLVVTAAAGVLALLLVCVAFILAPQSTSAQPPSGCTIDLQGPNDEPGQKDMNKMCVDYAGHPVAIEVGWQWDEIAWSGSNTGDACSLYDTDPVPDNLANYALCVTVGGDPAAWQDTRLYSCGNDRRERCSQPIVQISPISSACTATVQETDPFSGTGKLRGDAYPWDTVAECTVALGEIGGDTPTLLDVCSYPSQQPNSDPSDCIVYAPKKGFLEVRKALIPTDDSGVFDLLIDGTAFATDVGDGGSTGVQLVDAGSHTVSESAGTGTILDDYTTTWACTVDGAPGPSDDGTSFSVNVGDGQTVVCTFTNTREAGFLEVVKALVPTDDPGRFNLLIDESVLATNVGHNGTTGEQQVNTGIHTVGETAYGATNLNDYIIDIECLNAQGAVVAFSSDAGPLDVSVDYNDNIVCTVTNERKTGYLEVVKDLVPDNDPGTFNLLIDGIALATDVSDGGTTGEQQVNTGIHTVGETAYGATNLNDYIIDIECLNAQGAVVAFGSDAGPLDVYVGENDDIACTITNEDIPSSIEVIKTADPTEVPETGAPVTFTVVVNNTSAVDSITIDTLDDTIHGDITGVGNTTCSVPQALDVGEEYLCTFTAIVSGNAGETETDVVTASGLDDDGAQVSDSDDATVSFTDVKPAITATKWPFPAIRPQPGGQYVFTVRVSNQTLEPVELTSLVDDVYGDLNGKGDCSLPHDIDGGGFYQCSFSVLFTGDPKTQTDTVIAEAQDDEGNTASDDDDATISITFGGLLDGIEVTKTADPIFLPEPGGPVTFTVRVANGSPVDVTLTWLGDDIHGDLHGQGTCEVPQTIPAGEFYQCSFTADVQYYLAGESETDTVAAVAYDDQGLGAYATGSATVNIIPTGTVLHCVYVPLVMNNW